ncbi:MAG: hypothetical protein Q9218_007785, partial [Villophora microphyllina]
MRGVQAPTWYSRMSDTGTQPVVAELETRFRSSHDPTGDEGFGLRETPKGNTLAAPELACQDRPFSLELQTLADIISSYSAAMAVSPLFCGFSAPLMRVLCMSAAILVPADLGRNPIAKPVKQTLTITWTPGSPNGATRNIIKTNGQFPGPALTFDENDDVEITVHNQMPFNTTVHWHGLEMMGTPWSDGTPGLSQKPIDPGQSFVYRFKAYPAGTYWYHSHSRATLLDGLYGALFINPKQGSPAPWSLISSDQGDIKAMSRAAANPELIVVSDWSSFTSEQWLAAQEASHLDLFCGDSILVNGKGSVYCPGQPFLINQTSPFIQEALNSLNPTTPGPQTNETVVNDKGCFPFVQATQGIFNKDKDVSKIPPGLWSGCKPSTGDTAVITVNPGQKWASLNWIMAATFREIIFGIDEHDMWIYEIDGKYIEPQRIQTVTMIPGERYSVMVKLDKTPADYGIAVNDNGISQIIQGKAILRYRGSKPLNRPT